MGVQAIRDVDPGGHFFGTDHTMARYETAFYAPLVSDWQNNENWQAAGAKTATERATTLWQSILAEHEPPEIDPGIEESLEDYVARRKEAIGTDEP